ncbi:MAG TPA: TonB-dependent receptor [Syntrophales bacterium]|nr:TonB-dependent receptor [Syntrophales bacterium]
MKRLSKYVLLLCLVSPFSGFAAGPKTLLEEVVVTASRIEEPVKYAPDAVTVINRETIDKKASQTVLDVLRDVPGIYVSQNGKNGVAASIYLRGTFNAHTLLMIDGVKVSDPIAPDGKMSIADISADNIEKIEVIRGAQSVLYGSDAIGGVINIITRKGEGKPEITLSAEGGSFVTFVEKAGVKGAAKKVQYTAALSRLDSEGISSADEDMGNPEKDGKHATNVSARVDAEISETLRGGISLRHSRSRTDLDGYDFVARSVVDADEEQKTRITSFNLDLDHDLAGWWQQVIKIGATKTKRENLANDAFNGTYSGTTKLASWQHNFFIKDADTLTAGFDYQEERGDVESPWGNVPEQHAHTESFFIQNKLTPLKGLSFTLGARHDDHETFGGKDTYKTALAYFYEKTGTKIRGSYGTGFHAPSLYQLYAPATPWGPIGNDKLGPETSKSWDVGMEQYFFRDRLSVSVTYFHIDLDDLIDYDWVKGYVNIANARTSGWESALSFKPLSWLSANAQYTYTDTLNKTTGAALPYRPRHTGSAAVNVNPIDKLNVNLNARYVGKRYDGIYGIDVPDYTVFNLAAAYSPLNRLQIFGRIDNLTNKKYQAIYQYGEPGIGLFGGVKLTF